MAESDHRRDVTAVARDLLEPPVSAAMATATTSASSSRHESDEEEEEDESFTFAAVPPRLAAGGAFPGGRIGPVYPVFGRPRSPPLRGQQDLGTATALVPLGQLLRLEERGTRPGQPADGGGGLDGVPAETYCLWSPGASPPAPGSQSSPSSSPARCRKSGSTGSVLRWRQRDVGRSHSDGKEKFVFLDASSERNAGGGHCWMNHGRGGGKGGSGSDGRKSTFLPYKQDLVGFFANAGALRRSYLPF